MKEATLILPHQLFHEHPLVTPQRHIILVEEPYFFTRHQFHKQKLMLHRASLCAYYDQFDRRVYTVTYVSYDQDYWSLMKEYAIDCVVCCDPVDHPLREQLYKQAQEHHMVLSIHTTPAFLDAPGAVHILKQQSSYRMAPFYKKQRQRFDILMQDGKPVGGSYSFDADNRKSLPQGHEPPQLWHPSEAYINDARTYVEKNFPEHPGTTDTFCYPVTYEDACSWLDDFIAHRLVHFGDYQDAISTVHPFLYHSLLSPLLNIGLVTPEIVIERVRSAYQARDISMNNVEGFIRQVLGWREYIYAVYTLEGKTQKRSNFFDAQRKLPQAFWSGQTELDPVDMVIHKVLTYAYAHHIERLMIMGNSMLLCEFEPDAVYRWFMELFIDSYDWVMVPNVYGMGIFADGGMIVTKPYISSSRYIRKMSNIEPGSWCDIWDSLYWRFIDVHAKKLQNMGRMGLIMHHYKNMSDDDISQHRKRAETYLERIIS